MSNSKSSFSLKSINSDFIKRQQNVFDQLKVLENNRKNSTNDDQMELNEQIDCTRRTQRSITKHFRGKESIFKKPQNPAKNFINRMPDFKKNPHKWTRYSLEDVKEEDMSDKGNSRAALSFLKELEDRKINDVEIDEEKDVLPTKIVFKKRTLTNVTSKDSNIESSTSSFRSSKVIMPEYVVGQKIKKGKRNKSNMYNMNGKEKELKLDHLLNEEGD